jgi:hypothetical protein
MRGSKVPMREDSIPIGFLVSCLVAWLMIDRKVGSTNFGDFDDMSILA